MNVNSIAEQIDEEISRLLQARALLTDEHIKRGVGRPRKDVGTAVKIPKKRKLSADGRARIAAAQKARWEKLKKKSVPSKQI
jgi:hypothetical protein